MHRLDDYDLNISEYSICIYLRFHCNVEFQRTVIVMLMLATTMKFSSPNNQTPLGVISKQTNKEANKQTNAPKNTLNLYEHMIICH